MRCIVLALFCLLLAGCGFDHGIINMAQEAQIDRTRDKAIDDKALQIVYSNVRYASGINMYIIRDVETSKEYIVIENENGISIIQR